LCWWTHDAGESVHAAARYDGWHGYVATGNDGYVATRYDATTNGWHVATRYDGYVVARYDGHAATWYDVIANGNVIANGHATTNGLWSTTWYDGSRIWITSHATRYGNVAAYGIWPIAYDAAARNDGYAATRYDATTNGYATANGLWSATNDAATTTNDVATIAAKGMLLPIRPSNAMA